MMQSAKVITFNRITIDTIQPAFTTGSSLLRSFISALLRSFSSPPQLHLVSSCRRRIGGSNRERTFAREREERNDEEGTHLL